MTTFIRVIFLFTLLGGSAPVAIGLIRYKALDSARRLIWCLMLCSLVSNAVQITLALQRIPNLFIAHFYVLVEFVFLMLIYQQSLNKSLSAWWVRLSLVGFVAFSLVNAFYIQGLSANNSYQRTLEAVMVIAWILFYFYKTMQELKVQKISKEPMFWFSSGALLYFAGTLFIYLFSNYLLRYSKSLAVAIWAAHAFFLIIFYISTAVALWINPKK